MDEESEEIRHFVNAFFVFFTITLAALFIVGTPWFFNIVLALVTAILSLRFWVRYEEGSAS